MLDANINYFFLLKKSIYVKFENFNNLIYSLSINMTFSHRLISWYKIHKRDLPWRNTKDPYKIWVSEIILQQTRVNQGLAYYRQFIRQYPDLCSLAQAALDDVLKVWQGLGYYTRARNLHQTAQYIKFNLNGLFPDNYKELLRLKGVGDYTASAIASFAFGESVAVVDGNVQRVIARLTGLEMAVNSGEGRKIIKKQAEKLLSSDYPALHNQAMIEFGAIQCAPRNPECSICPLNKPCYAYQHNKVHDLPVKIKQRSQKLRYFYYLKIKHNNHIFLEKRSRKDIWNSLYQFPLIEADNAIKIHELTHLLEWEQIFHGSTHTIKNISRTYTHLLTHQKIIAQFIEVEIPRAEALHLNHCIRVDEANIHQLAIPRLIEKYLEEQSEKPN